MRTKTGFAVITTAMVLGLGLGGCATTNFNAKYQHISHLSAGWPQGPRSEEDSLNHIAVCAERPFIKSIGATTELCVGYKLRDGGFYGPRDTASLTLEFPLFPRSRSR